MHSCKWVWSVTIETRLLSLLSYSLNYTVACYGVEVVTACGHPWVCRRCEAKAWDAVSDSSVWFLLHVY